MNMNNISPTPQQPVERKPAGKLPEALAELSEAALQNSVSMSGIWGNGTGTICSYDGDDEASMSGIWGNGTGTICSYDGGDE